MKYSEGETDGWKRAFPHYDACWWKIHVPEANWKTATIHIKFKIIEEGIKLHLYGDDGIGDGIQHISKELTEDNGPPVVGVDYTLDMAFNATLVAVPTKDATNTHFEFEFWLTGE